jgi:betaine-aldehyde dehydrogenase
MANTPGSAAMISPVLHLKQAGRLDRFFIDGEWTLP